MSLPTMGAGRGVVYRRLAPALVVAGLFAACGQATDDVRAAADRALARADGLEDEIGRMRAALDEVSGRLADAEAARDRALRDLRRAAARWERSSARLRAALADRAASLEEGIAGALSEARAAARDATILKERYDYHLRRYHGGGP